MELIAIMKKGNLLRIIRLPKGQGFASVYLTRKEQEKYRFTHMGQTPKRVIRFYAPETA